MKPKEYSLLGGALLAAGTTSNQTKFYTDIDPDIQMEAGDPWLGFSLITNLDLNNDGNDDLKFRLFGTTSYTGFAATGEFLLASAFPLGQHQMLHASTEFIGFCLLGDYAGNFRNVANYSNGQIINPDPASGIFSDPPTGIRNNNLFVQRDKSYFSPSWYLECTGGSSLLLFTEGLWFDAAMKSIPLKLKYGANFYTGWIRLTVVEGDITIHDYAISLEADMPIIAGDISDAIISEVPIIGPVITGVFKANITWSSVPDAVGYRLRYREISAPVWTIKKVDALSKIVKSLNCDTEYQFQVQAIFDNAPEMNSAWSPLETFTTGSCKLAETAPDISDVIIYPSPAVDFVNIKTISNSYTVEMFIEMYDLQGNMVRKYITNAKEFQMDVSDLSSGTYIITVNTGIDEHIIQKIVISR